MSEISNVVILVALASILGGCSSASDPVASTSSGVCTEAYDWHDFPDGLQCVGGVDGFFANHFGVSLPPLCQYASQAGCASCGACEFWVANAPNPAVWDRMSSGTPQLFDMIVYPPIGNNPYGHVAVVDHVANGVVYVMDDNYVAYQTKASCPHTVSWGAYGWYRLKALEDQPPAGWLDSADCTQIAGWTWDPDTASQAIGVDFYFDGPAGSGQGIHWSASVHRPDLCTAIGSCDHGFSLPTPMGLMDGKPHAVYAYGIDSSGNGQNPLLQGAPKSFTCAPPPLPQPAVKRHVTDPAVWSTWKFDGLVDVEHVSDAQLDAVAQSADIPATPALVTPDDGSGGVFIVDGEVVRHVQDPASMSAWRFDWNAIVKIPAAKFATMSNGAPWPEKPLLAQGSGPAVYVIDVAPPGPPPQPSSDAGAPTNDAGEPIATTQTSGCSASSARPDGAWALLLAAFALVRRRRTH